MARRFFCGTLVMLQSDDGYREAAPVTAFQSGGLPGPAPLACSATRHASISVCRHDSDPPNPSPASVFLDCRSYGQFGVSNMFVNAALAESKCGDGEPPSHVDKTGGRSAVAFRFFTSIKREFQGKVHPDSIHRTASIRHLQGNRRADAC